jgi:hypothetical protein
MGGPQLGPCDLAAKDRQLVAKHDDLQLHESLGTKTQRCKLQEASEHDIAKRPEQRPAPPKTMEQADDSTSEKRADRRGTELKHPTRRTDGLNADVAAGNGGYMIRKICDCHGAFAPCGSR